MAFDLFTFGETMGLFTPGPGSTFADPTIALRFGGSESNVAVTASRLGLSVRWHSRLGADPVGAHIRQQLLAEGVDLTTVAIDPVRNTGLMLKERTAQGQTAVYYYRRESAASALEDAFPYAAIGAARWLHATGITPALSDGARAAWHGAINEARAKGVPISLDPNIRLKLWTAEEARRVILEAMREGIALFVPNLEEAELLFGPHSPAELVTAAHAAGAKQVALKMAENGALLSTGEQIWHQPAWTGLPVVDTVGAGDCFTGGLITGLLQGGSLDRAGRLAAYCGARAVSAIGDWEAAPTRADVLRDLGPTILEGA